MRLCAREASRKLIISGIFLVAVVLIGCKDHPVNYPWYDHPQEKYKEYTAEEIRKYIPEKPRPGPSLSMLGPLVRAALYVLLAAMVAGIVYFLIRYFRQNRSTAPEFIELPVADPVYLPIAETDLPLHLQGSYELKQLVESALQGKDFRRAAIFIFLYLIATLSEKQLLQTKKSGTAREYARRMKKLLPGLQEKIEYSRKLFEQALYGEIIPEYEAAALWQDIQAGASSI